MAARGFTTFLARASKKGLSNCPSARSTRVSPIIWSSRGYRELNRPPTANEMPRPAGIASFMRLPVQKDAKGLNACFVGVPLDIGTSNRPGTRFGPRQIRTESVMCRAFNKDTGAAPYESLNVGDIGDVPVNIYNLEKAVEDIKKFYSAKILAMNCIPITLGGEHTISYPILLAMKAKHGPVAMIHVDAHMDVSPAMMGNKIAHGTPFRRAVEAGCLQGNLVWQIGIRGQDYDYSDLKYAKEQGFHVIEAKDCWYKSLVPLMDNIKKELKDTPVYLSFDIDGIDPAFAPGTGEDSI
ncbi:unnamed protein product [Darwinula stevensoni]|uniref:Agmatinase n=1 Tax=Darwinula stevensoni TaxID=69355 RepID=A0A7R9A0X7_9CRUS|nr:unnamed protein product [Darwinula stevensoni]CAG0886525.1 unnamed protein product [Darwinula stevensoni]